VTGKEKRLRNEELHELSCSLNIILVIKTRIMGWAEYVARMGDRVLMIMMMIIIIIIIIINVSNIPGKHEVKELQKTAILGTAHILRKVLM